MWYITGTSLQMVEGDYGISLPVTVSGTTLTTNDALKFVFKSAPNGETILTKEYTNITQNTVNLELTDAESALFSVGNYFYSLDWYQSGVFMCNIIPQAVLKVVDKA